MHGGLGSEPLFEPSLDPGDEDVGGLWGRRQGRAGSFAGVDEGDGHRHALGADDDRNVDAAKAVAGSAFHVVVKALQVRELRGPENLHAMVLHEVDVASECQTWFLDAGDIDRAGEACSPCQHLKLKLGAGDLDDLSDLDGFHVFTRSERLQQPGC